MGCFARSGEGRETGSQAALTLDGSTEPVQFVGFLRVTGVETGGGDDESYPRLALCDESFH